MIDNQAEQEPSQSPQDQSPPKNRWSDKIVSIGEATKKRSMAELAEGVLTGKDLTIAQQAQKIELLKKTIEKVAEEAKIDSQTRLRNKNAFLHEAFPLLMVSHRLGQPISAIALDVQGLKVINDTLGHDAGDEYIASVGKVVRKVMESRKRDSDLGYRTGGDEFVLLLPDTDLGGAIRAAEDFLAEFSAEGVKIGMGVGVLNGSVESFSEIDQALYESKAEGYRREKENIGREKTGEPLLETNNIKAVGLPKR